MNYRAWVMIFILACLHSSATACTIFTSTGGKATHLKDAIATLLTAKPDCPKNVFELRKRIKAANLILETTMVANRGYHNPSEGSFSFFEMVSGKLNSLPIQHGDFFFGHFTTVDDNDELTADQGPTATPRLMVEAFAWDPDKKLFNFYELIGDGSNNQWFYRGDSSDIAADNTLLHRQPDPAHPQFGNRLRCSACHGAGGPIMKEIDAPHNDWWSTDRKLDFGGRVFNASLFEFMEHLVSADRLAENVVLGLKKLQNNQMNSSQTSVSLQEILRPLFCPVEVNLKSDNNPNENKALTIEIPIEFFIDKRLIDQRIEKINISRIAYEKALLATGSHFPETSLQDADHAWLTPVKATSDQLAIDKLIRSGLIDTQFADHVLSIDMTNPVFSPARCSLLQYVPNTWSSSWKNSFIQHLQSSTNPAALQLFTKLSDESSTPEYYQQKGMDFVNHCVDRLQSEENIKQLYLLLLQRRAEIKASEISKNRRGQILEPGFRVIFPETNVKPVPGKLMLNDACEVIDTSVVLSAMTAR